MKRIVNALSKLNWGTRACAVLALCAATAIALPAQTATLTTLYQFCSQSGCTDGANPHAGLVQATSGDLYGTTYGGGTNNGGTIFKITPHGTLMSLYSFCSLRSRGKISWTFGPKHFMLLMWLRSPRWRGNMLSWILI